MLLIAAGLTVLLALAHSYLGERYLLIRLLRREDLPKLLGGTEFTKRTLRFAWHLTSIAWLGLAAMMARGARLSPQELGAILAATAGLSGLGAFVGSRGRHLSWIVFLAVAVLCWRGSR